MVVMAVQIQFANARYVHVSFPVKNSSSITSYFPFRMSPKMPIGTNASMSMECLWQDVFTIVKIMVIAKMIVSLSSKDAQQIAPARLVESKLIQTVRYSLTLYIYF